MTGKTSTLVAKTNTKPNSIVNAPIKPDAEMHILIGGAYTLDGQSHPYGHTAIRIKSKRYDLTYDFGRYGRTTGDFGAEGEGILRVWSDFNKYIASENALRKTTGFQYVLFQHQADSVKQYFDQKISAGINLPDKERTARKGQSPFLKVYRLPQSYHALGYNCTTISLDGAKQAFPKFENGSPAFIKPENVLTIAERIAMKTIGGGVPNRIFLPDNLQDFLLAAPAVPSAAIVRYP